MAKIPARVSSRLADGIKRYQPIVASAKSRDLNEADTSRLVTDILSDVCGFDRYTEITSEYSIRGDHTPSLDPPSMHSLVVNKSAV